MIAGLRPLNELYMTIHTNIIVIKPPKSTTEKSRGKT